MARALRCMAVALAATAPALALSSQAQEQSLFKSWDATLSRAGARDTPVTRVVGLLKDMQSTLEKDAAEDKDLYKKLKCWCNDNAYAKGEAIGDAETKIAELQATIEALTAKSADLKVQIKELEDELAADKTTLKEATAVREKELEEFRAIEIASIQNIEDMKGALKVLSRVSGAALPQLGVSLLALGSKREPAEDRSLDAFMASNGFNQAPQDGFLSKDTRTVAAHAVSSGLSADDMALLRKGMKTAATLLQKQGRSGLQGGPTDEIVGILNNMKEEQEGDLKKVQEQESLRAGAFAKLRSAKNQEIEAGEAMIEEKEDTLATTDNDLATAKEDLEETQGFLADSQQFAANLKQTCDEADKNFEARRAARLAEIKAVSETIEILTGDEARDAMSGTFSFMQVAASRASERSTRRQAAAVLRSAALKARNPSLSMMATSVELDNFAKVKESIDTMVAALKAQQADEVKKNDYCKSAIHENEMLAAKATDRKNDLDAKVASLESQIQALEQDILNAKAQIEQTQVALQKATEDRLSENKEFQTTFGDQTVTIAILKKAHDKLAKFYEAAFLQAQQRARQGQTPPVPQAEYKPSGGAAGVLQMIEKLIGDAQKLVAESEKTEAAAQGAYEKVVADSNAAIDALQAEVASKTDTKAQTEKAKLQTESDVADTVTELFDLSKENGDLHKECDFLLKNFDLRQQAIGEEVESLQQAKQILSGASLA